MLKIIIRYWLPIAIVATGLAWLPYAVGQQVLRQSANDPQIQMAQDSATKLENGQSIQQVVPLEKVDIAKSLAPYIIVFDANGQPIASSAQLNGQTPTIPAGVFDDVRQTSEDRITWQPQPDVRSAIVVTQFKGATSGFVLAGRSLREVEQREDGIMLFSLFAWSMLLIVSLLATMICFKITPTLP